MLPLIRLLRHPQRLCSLQAPKRKLSRPQNTQFRTVTTRSAQSALPFPTTKSCPSSTCCSTSAISLPETHPIDRARPLNGTMAAYAQQLLISTGKDDWTSRIEDDGENEAWGVLGREMKKFMGRGGEYADVSLYLHALRRRIKANTI